MATEECREWRFYRSKKRQLRLMTCEASFGLSGAYNSVRDQASNKISGYAHSDMGAWGLPAVCQLHPRKGTSTFSSAFLNS
jgi:hypothetical protein